MIYNVLIWFELKDFIIYVSKHNMITNLKIDWADLSFTFFRSNMNLSDSEGIINVNLSDSVLKDLYQTEALRKLAKLLGKYRFWIAFF